MFQKVGDADFVRGEHEMLRLWGDRQVFRKLRAQNAGGQPWSFFDGPMTANNPMGVHHAWGRTYKDTFHRYWAMNGRALRYQNGFDCQGLWVEVEVEKQLGLGAKSEIEKFGIDRFVQECKKRVLKYAAIQTAQSIRLGYWMDWDHPQQLRALADAIGTTDDVTLTTPTGQVVTGPAEELVARLGCAEWGGSYFTFSTENNETIWAFLKKCHTRGKVYRGYDVMPWSGRGGSAYSQMEVADGRKLTVHRALFVRLPLEPFDANEHLLVWTTTPWTLTSNVAAMVNPELEYVRLQAKKDGAVYYFAKDNLEFARLAKEFKEGFGRPEWAWPKDCPKLKTLAQMFKEQGGFEVLGTVLGAELVGRRYRGPFDHLPAQQQVGGLPVDPEQTQSSAQAHRVLDGGRDFKGNANVVAGEGTGIVHCAPGCGDIDHTIGMQQGLPQIAPLGEDGCFVEGFGSFTGRNATSPETVELVIEELKRQDLLLAVERYPHIYPFCWRTGDELVFRLVDEWFINMDWREEIIDVTKQIEWLPGSIQGQERELEWLSNMRDWMISKKRYWGLALPIWVNPEDPTDFDVMGSLAELKERAVAGWPEFDGHTPHKPWIDAIKIRSEKTGALLSRVPDVGNPWLDAGIVPFSTIGYNTDRTHWQQWYPADLVTECFPGQFRNWFYSLLSLSTMMRYEETENAAEKRPFKTLLGHRLVMNEAGKPMHKSDGTAIWFEEAAEQLGVDTMRWMYLQQNPAQDLKFGTRVPEQKVTLETVDGPSSTTIDGVPTCLVKSTPADDVRRLVLLPLWNSYSFFVNYARLDEFDPVAALVPVAERPEIDRWMLSNLQQLIADVRTSIEAYDTPAMTAAISAFIDDLSNWYIRRNRRRFWRARDTADTDKLAAYQTLYQVLVTLSQLLAPMVPFLAERMYQNLVFGDAAATPSDTPESVHLCHYPEADESLLDAALNNRMALAQRVVRLGHQLRDAADVRVRQPLAELRVCVADAAQAPAIQQLAEVIGEELNVKQLVVVPSLDDIVRYTWRANLKTLGPRYGKLLSAIREQIPQLPREVVEPLRQARPIEVQIAGQPVTLEPGDVEFSTEHSEGWVATDDRSVQVALSTRLDLALIQEGTARDVIRQVQQLRKEADLDIQQRIVIGYSAEDTEIDAAIQAWTEVIRQETLADGLTSGEPVAEAKQVTVGSGPIALWIRVA